MKQNWVLLAVLVVLIVVIGYAAYRIQALHADIKPVLDSDLIRRLT